MRRKFLAAPFALFAAITASAQAPPPATPSTTPGVFLVGPGITAPELLRTDFYTGVDKHCQTFDGTALVGFVVGIDGTAQNIRVLQSSSALGEVAVHIVAIDKFKPGSRDGLPAAVAMQDKIEFSVCTGSPSKKRAEEVAALLYLTSQPVQTLDAASAVPTPPQTPPPADLKLSKDINAPSALKLEEARYSDYARRHKISGVCMLKLTVDTNGLPQDIHVVQNLDPSLDWNAYEAVSQYRFKPATKDGEPVPVQITIQVNFRLY